MTILNKFLIFNKPTIEVECISCRGTGKVKISSVTGGTQMFIAAVGVTLAMSILSLFSNKEFKYFIIYLVITIILSTIGLLALKEYKQQTQKGN